MNAAILQALLEANLAAAAAVLFVLVARRPVIRLLGSGAAYLLWAIVPTAMLATLIPARTITVAAPVAAETAAQSSGTAGHALGVLAMDASALASPMLMLVWLIGATATAGWLMQRQRRFMADMGRGEAGPAVVGFFRPRIVTPSDFADRFNPLEQKLVLAHENIHLERHDTRINAAVALARCVCWFNPMVHVGARMLRIDQEMSCDAAVVERRPRTRRAYAETLLKTQLAARPLPVGCYWPPAAVHPLTERVGMLTRRPFSEERRLASATAVVAMVAGAGFAAWSLQPAREIQGPPVLLFADAVAWPYAIADQTIFIMSAAAPGSDSASEADRSPAAFGAKPCSSAPADAAKLALSATLNQPASREDAAQAACEETIAIQWPPNAEFAPPGGLNKRD